MLNSDIAYLAVLISFRHVNLVAKSYASQEL